MLAPPVPISQAVRGVRNAFPDPRSAPPGTTAATRGGGARYRAGARSLFRSRSRLRASHGSGTCQPPRTAVSSAPEARTARRSATDESFAMSRVPARTRAAPTERRVRRTSPLVPRGPEDRGGTRSRTRLWSRSSCWRWRARARLSSGCILPPDQDFSHRRGQAGSRSRFPPCRPGDWSLFLHEAPRCPASPDWPLLTRANFERIGRLWVSDRMR
jgi:hypothetical protein